MLQRPRNNVFSLIYCGLLLMTGLVTAGIEPALAADPTGDWRVADGVANIRVAECYGSMWGAVAWEKVPGGRDQNNPDAAKQSRPTLGMPILIDMKKTATADQWEGQVYNGKDGQLYKSTIKLNSPDQLEIQGCVLGFLCGGETWTRVAGPIPSSPVNSPAPANSMAKSGSKTTVATAPKSVAPKTAVPTTGAAPKAGQKNAANAQPADPVGDICLLPDIAGFPH
jgi:uncharacterized protein (DUF2147 family)